MDARLLADSPAVDTGVAVPEDWPDPIRAVDGGAPDIGALPLGAPGWSVGVRGRLRPFGEPVLARPEPLVSPLADRKPAPPSCRVAIVEGYPAPNAPIVAWALERNRALVADFPRQWLPSERYGDYDIVVLTGDFQRARMSPAVFSEADLVRVQAFLERGGVLLVVWHGLRAFESPAGKAWWRQLFGEGDANDSLPLHVLKPTHEWVRHLADAGRLGWLEGNAVTPVMATQAEVLIGAPDGRMVLGEKIVGAGRIVYLGWDLSRHLPQGRQPGTPEDEAVWEQQAGIVMGLAADLAAGR